MDNNWEKIDKKPFTEKKYKGNNKNIENKFIICILCGGLKQNGNPNEFVKNRLDKGLELYNKNKNAYFLILGGGTYHKPPFVNSGNYVVHESTSGARYLYENGVNPNNILREWSSYDTIANGFFAFTNYLNYIDINKIFLITSDFHIERSKTIFNYFNKLFEKDLKINFISTESNIEKNILETRKQREKKSNENFINNIVTKIKTKKEFIKWFYTKHNAYKAIIEYVENKDINKTY